MSDKSDINIKLNVMLIEDGVVWLESDDQTQSADLPVQYNIGDRTFTFSKLTETHWCFNDEVGYHIVARNETPKDMVLYLQLSEQVDGYMIEDGKIFNIVEKPTVH